MANGRQGNKRMLAALYASLMTRERFADCSPHKNIGALYSRQTCV